VSKRWAIGFPFSLVTLVGLFTNAVAANADSLQNDNPYNKAYAAVDKLFAGRYFKGEILEVVAGDLNGDGIEDLAMILGSLNYPQLAVLWGNVSGDYDLGAQSLSFCGARYQFALEIKKNSLFATTVHTANPSDHTYQFAFRQNRLILIGLEESNLGNEQDNGFGKSVNYLTHQVIYWRFNKHRRIEISRNIPNS
jgi:hypothetical protein